MIVGSGYFIGDETEIKYEDECKDEGVGEIVIDKGRGIEWFQFFYWDGVIEIIEEYQ